MTRVLPLGDSEFQPSRRTRVMVFRQICRRMKLRGVYPSASAPKWQKSTEKSGSPRLLLSITPRGSEARSPSLWCDRVAVYSANQKDSIRSCDSARHFLLQKWECAADLEFSCICIWIRSPTVSTKYLGWASSGSSTHGYGPIDR